MGREIKFVFERRRCPETQATKLLTQYHKPYVCPNVGLGLDGTRSFRENLSCLDTVEPRRSDPAVGAAAALPDLAGRPHGANDRLRVALLGVKGQGRVHATKWSDLKDAEVAAVCDPDSNIINDAMTVVEKKTGQKPAYVQDLRKIMDDKTIDAVSIAMPNHWHVLASIWAIQSGKDVYVEKPLGHNIWEQRKLVEASRKHNKIVQMGNYTRSLQSHRSAIEYLRSGKLGKVKVAHGICYGARGSIRKLADAPVPAGVDYNLWQGRRRAAVQPNRFHYNWHWNFEGTAAARSPQRHLLSRHRALGHRQD
jgi:hypothetical protein